MKDYTSKIRGRRIQVGVNEIRSFRAGGCNGRRDSRKSSARGERRNPGTAPERTGVKAHQSKKTRPIKAKQALSHGGRDKTRKL